MVFAKAVYAGHYSADKTEAAKMKLREDLLKGSSLEKTRISLKSAPKIGRRLTQIKDGDQDKFEKFFASRSGNLKEIAAATQISLSLLEQFPPDDATDFAEKLLDGMYTLDMTAAARDEMRKCMRVEMPAVRRDLK